MKTLKLFIRHCDRFSRILALIFFIFLFSSCGGGVGSLLSSLSFTDQDVEQILNLVRQSQCHIIDVDELRGLVNQVGDNADEVFGISREEVNQLLDDYEQESRDSLCIVGATLSESATHQAHFFTIDSDHQTRTWDTADIQITETLADESTQIYTPDSITPLSNFASDLENTSFSFSSVMDYSGSMSDSDLIFLEAGLTFFYENLPDNFSSEIIKFSTHVEIIQSYTDDNDALLSAIQNRNIRRATTALYDAMYRGVEDTATETGNLRFVVSFTDGLENDSSRSRSDVITLAQTNNIPMVNIGMGTIVDIADLLEISNRTGGFFFYVIDSSTLNTMFTQFANYINNTHVVTWTSLNPSGVQSVTISTPDGTFTGTYTP